MHVLDDILSFVADLLTDLLTLSPKAMCVYAAGLLIIIVLLALLWA